VTLTRTGTADQVLADHGAGGLAAASCRSRPLPGLRLPWPDPGAVTLTRTGAADQVLADHGAGGFAAVLPLPGTSRTSATWPDPGAVTLTRTGAADQVLADHAWSTLTAVVAAPRYPAHGSANADPCGSCTTCLRCTPARAHYSSAGRPVPVLPAKV
jgi:hypothetical protein